MLIGREEKSAIKVDKTIDTPDLLSELIPGIHISRHYQHPLVKIFHSLYCQVM